MTIIIIAILSILRVAISKMLSSIES
jgi:hypothetical protein